MGEVGGHDMLSHVYQSFADVICGKYLGGSRLHQSRSRPCLKIEFRFCHVLCVSRVIMKFSTKSVGVVVMLDAVQALGLAVDINPV